MENLVAETCTMFISIYQTWYMCVCVCVCVYIYIYILCVCMHICIYVCTYVCMCEYMNVRLYACIYVCMYLLGTYVWMYVCMYVCSLHGNWGLITITKTSQIIWSAKKKKKKTKGSFLHIVLLSREFIQKNVTCVQGQKIPYTGNYVNLLMQSQVTYC